MQGRVYAYLAQGQEDPAIAHLLPDVPDGGGLVVAHAPVALGAADLIEEVAEHLTAVLGVVHLGMVLDAVEAPALVGNGHVGAGVGVSDQGEALGDLLHIVAVAHPGDASRGDILEEAAGGIEPGLGLAVLPGGIVLGGGDPAPQGVGHQLAAVADAENGDAQFKEGGVHVGGGVVIDAVGAAGEDEADGGQAADLLQGQGVGLDLAVHPALTDPAGDELVILAAEVQNDDSLMGQGGSLLLVNVNGNQSRKTMLPGWADSMMARDSRS